MAENCEAYEAHMETIRDYLEERLAVSARSLEPGAQPGPGAGRGLWGQPRGRPAAPEGGAPDRVFFADT